MFYTSLFLLGLCLGSFINALVWRIRNKRDWVHERSECVHCGHKLSAADLVPVFSWLALRGKCRYCGKKIDDTPLTELTTGVLFALSYAAWIKPISGLVLAEFVSWLILLTILIALALYDMRHMQLPDKLVLSASLPVLAYIVIRAACGDPVYIMDAFVSLVAFGGLFYVLFQVSSGKWIGGGDVKLGFVLGAWLGGFELSLLAIFVASLVGTIYIGILSLTKKVSLKSRVPFGPMLIVGTIFMTLYGGRLVAWYQGLFISF